MEQTVINARFLWPYATPSILLVYTFLSICPIFQSIITSILTFVIYTLLRLLRNESVMCSRLKMLLVICVDVSKRMKE